MMYRPVFFVFSLIFYIFPPQRHVSRCRRPWNRTALFMIMMLSMMKFKIRDRRKPRKPCMAQTKG